jgi:amino acid adenylation domain-containing protein
MLDVNSLKDHIAEILRRPPSTLDLDASFSGNGGDSLALIQLQRELRLNGLTFTASLVFSAVSLAELLHLVAERAASNPLPPPRAVKRKRSSDQRFLTKFARTSQIGDVKNVAVTQELEFAHSYPMTEMQFTLLRGSFRNPALNIIHYHETHHSRNIPLLRAAWKIITDAEPMLRCTYKLLGSGAHLVEQHQPVFNWKEVVVSDEGSFERLIREQEAEEDFFGSRFRVVTLRGKDQRQEKSRIIWQVHHCLVDGYSHALLLSKVRSVLLGDKLPPHIPFPRFVAGLHALQTSSKATGEAFWKARNTRPKSWVSRIPFPAPSTSSAQPKNSCPVVEIQVDSKNLSDRCKHLGFTLSTLYHAAWALILARYTGSNSVCFGTVLSGRGLPIPNIEEIIGPTINTLPLHVQVQQSSSFVDLMRQILEQLMALALHEWTVPEHGFSRDFYTALNIQIRSEADRDPVFEMLDIPFNSVRSEIPLQVEATQEGRIRMHYNADLFDLRQVERLCQNLAAVLSMPWHTAPSLETCLSSVVEAERGELSRLGNWERRSTRTGSVRDDLVSLFLKASRLNPSAIALQKGSKSMTYHELDMQSTKIARRLSHLVHRGSVVCIHADASFNWIVAIYAVLKAGAVYCPFTEELPAEMRTQNFFSSGAKLFLATSEKTKAKKPQNCEMCFSIEELLRGDDIGTHVDTLDMTPLDMTPNAGADAYLCFTSGSTGKPKGVVCQHKGIVAFQTDITIRLCARPGWKVAQFMSPAFDGSIHEIFSALSYGATLLLKDPNSPLDHIGKADSVILTPSIARELDPVDYPNLKTVYLVGEVVTPDVRDLWRTKTLYNMYGPTESTCGATIKKLSPNQPITLGRPNPSTRIYILDSQQHLSPRGVVGEICSAGIQVASGYLNRPDETTKRFLLDTINPLTQEYLYRTGDRGYWDENGELVFLGRSDRQIKLRGFRIDMDDLEVRLLKASTEATAVAIALSGNELVALITPSRLDMKKFRKLIAAQVPSYALPRRIMPVDKFPTTSAGKLDYKRIEREAELIPDDVSSGAVPTPLESTITSSVREVLGTVVSPMLGPDSNFLDSGITSITLLLLAQRLSKVLAKKILVRHLLQWQTPRKLASCIDELDCIDGHDGGIILGEHNVAPVEADWWDKYQANPETSAFNVNFVCTVNRTIDIQGLAKAWDHVLARHRILRCKYQRCANSCIRRLYDEAPPMAEIVKSFDIDKEINTPFDLRKGKLIRVILSPSHMSVVVSHIICDLTTLNILLHQVAGAYHGRVLSPVEKQYSQTSWRTVPPATHVAFWSSYLKDARAPAFFDRVRRKTTWAGTSHAITISEPIYARMKAYAVAEKVTIHQMTLAAVALALRDDNEVDIDITIGAPYLNRNSEEDQTVVGLFLEPLPIRIQHPSPDEDGRKSFLRTVQAASRSALSHAIPFHHLTSCLGITSTFPSHPLFDAVVTFHEADRRPRFPVAGTRAMDRWSEGAKFALLAEFSETRSGKLALRLEYSTECFAEDDMISVARRIERSLNFLGGAKDS